MSNSLIRWTISIIVSVFITFVIFLSMQKIIKITKITNYTKKDYQSIDFVQLTKQDNKPRIKQKIKQLPPEPKHTRQRPALIKNNVSQNTHTTNNIPVNSPNLNINLPNLAGGISIPQEKPQILEPIKEAKIDSALIPIVKIQPIYPSRARMEGIEGYVKIELEVNKTGTVTKITIIKSVPKGVFNEAVINAVKRWKFKPKTINGKPVKQVGILTINFKLDEE